MGLSIRKVSLALELLENSGKQLSGILEPTFFLFLQKTCSLLAVITKFNRKKLKLVCIVDDVLTLKD